MTIGRVMWIGVVAAGCCEPARAQEPPLLPPVIVTSPSPILTRRTTPRPPGPSLAPLPVPQRTARRRSPEARPVPAPAPPPEVPVLPPALPEFGILPVVLDAFSPVTVLSRPELDASPQRSLGDLLSEKPGISASSYAPGIASRPIIRGLDNFRVRIQENGVGVQDVSELGEDHAVPLDPLAADQIEVIRGPATLRYGSQAIGGVVSATNNRIPTLIPEGGVQGRITGGGETVSTGLNGAMSVDAGGAATPGGLGGAVHVDAFGRRADDYDTPRGRQLNSYLDAHGWSTGGSVIGSSGFIGLAFQHYDALYGIPGLSDARNRTRLQVNQDKVTSKGEWRPDGGFIESVRFFFGASRYKHNELGLDEDGLDGVRATFRNREYEARIEAQHVPVWTPFGSLAGALGVQAGRRNIDTSGEAGTLLRPAETRTFATYLFEELSLTDTLKLQAAGRIERAFVYGTAANFPAGFLPDPDNPVDLLESRRRREFLPASASIGLKQILPFGFVGTLNGQYVERAPSSPELFSQGAHDATETFEIGNPNLKKEIAKTVEVGLRRAEGPFRFDATGYYTRYDGFIFKQYTGVLCGDDFPSCGVDTDNRQIVYSQRDATFYGAEVAGQLDIWQLGRGFVGIDGQYDFVHARFDDGTYVPRIPPHRAGAGLYYRDSAWFLRVGFLHAFAHTEIGTLETTTPGFNLLKAEVNYTKKLDPKSLGFNEVRLGIVGDNLLNEEVRNSASFKKDEILLPGRTVRAYVSLRF